MNKEIELIVYAEECCELCMDIIHNHIDCPMCKKDYAPTDKYCDLTDEKEITCENCNTTFYKISESWYDECKVKIKTQML